METPQESKLTSDEDSDNSLVSAEQLNGDYEDKLQRMKAKLEKAHAIELKKVHSIAMQKAKEWVNKASKQLTRAVTLEFRALVKQFVNFRDKTWKAIDTIKDYGIRMVDAEQLVVQQYPVYDYRYRADPDSPFRLYDCLAPALKEHERVPDAMLPRGYSTDIRLMMAYKKQQIQHEEQT